MASSSIKIALEMTGVQAYANATERAAQANEKLAERSKKSIAGIMSSTQRMVDMATKSKEQMTLEKLAASGASPEQIAQVKARFAQVEQVRAAEKAAAAAKAAEEQRAKDQAMAQAAAAKEAAEARRASEVAAAQKSKETQLKIHKQLMAEKAAADKKYQRTLQYAESTKSGPMFGKTLGPLLKGFVGFKAVDLGLGALANGLEQLASGGKVDKLKLYADTVTSFVKGLPAGDHIYSIAKSLHALFLGGPSAEEIEAKTQAMVDASQRRLSTIQSYQQKMESISRETAKVGKSKDDVAKLDLENTLADEKKRLIAGGVNEQGADRMIQEMRRAMDALERGKYMAEIAKAANTADPALHLSLLQEQQRIAHELVTSERDLYIEKTAQLVLDGRITAAQAEQLRSAYDKTQAVRAQVEAKRESEAKARQEAADAAQFMQQLQESYDQQMLSEEQLFQKKLKSLTLTAEQVAEANRLHEAMARQTQEAEARNAVERMYNFSNVESLNTAIGGVKVAGMTSFSLERMMPTQEAIRRAVEEMAKNSRHPGAP